MTSLAPSAAGGEAYNSIHDDGTGKLMINSRKPSASLLPSSRSKTQTEFSHPYFHTLKFLLHVFTITYVVIIIFQIRSLHGGTTLIASSPMIHYSLIYPFKSSSFTSQNDTMILQKLRESVTFLPLKDLRYADTAYQGHTWFMSTLHDSREEGEVQHQHFPSKSSHNRLLCLKGNYTHDGTRNSYALAYPEALPENATLFHGLTFITYNHYDYANLWHGLTSLFPLTAWHMRQGNCRNPSRWFLYHYGELRTRTSPWLGTLMEATYGGRIRIHGSNGLAGLEGPFCFEEAVVTRHNEGGMARVRREETFDLLRCKAREYCKVKVEMMKKKKINKVPVIGMTMFMRTGGRSFKNDSAVISIFKRACAKVEGCRLQVAYSNNLTFCEQVKLMSETDILVSPHGAQLTNMFFMDKNSSVLEFFPKGWLKLAGVGQYVYRSLASWSGMQHRGAWRDPDGPNCPNDRNCMSVYKNARIGHNHTYFSQWAKSVLDETRAWKLGVLNTSEQIDATCACS